MYCSLCGPIGLRIVRWRVLTNCCLRSFLFDCGLHLCPKRSMSSHTRSTTHLSAALFCSQTCAATQPVVSSFTRIMVTSSTDLLQLTLHLVCFAPLAADPPTWHLLGAWVLRDIDSQSSRPGKTQFICWRNPEIEHIVATFLSECVDLSGGVVQNEASSIVEDNCVACFATTLHARQRSRYFCCLKPHSSLCSF